MRRSRTSAPASTVRWPAPSTFTRAWRWPTSRWTSATRTPAVKLGGPGTLVLTGADRFLGKPVALQVADGTLRLAAPLRVEVAAPRFGAHAGGTLIVATPHVRAVADDLKLVVSQTGVLALRAERWSPGFDLDVATSRTLGLGPHVIDRRGSYSGAISRAAAARVPELQGARR